MSEQEKIDFRCGMVSIVGRPNVGKSTLLNRILEEKVAIVSRVPQTTRNQIRGVYNDEQCQIIFIDTPGLHIGRDKLDKCMNASSSNTFQDADCIIYLVDTSRRVGEEEELIVQKLKKIKRPIVLGLNKVDLKGENLPAYISLWEQAKGKPITEIEGVTLLPLSGREGINIEKLIEILFEHLPPGPPLYPQDVVCDVPQKMAISDIIREKLFNLMKDEIPHSIGVVIEDMRPIKGKTFGIRAVIYIEKDSQKEIVIGKGGQILKKVGTLARVEIEELLETKVFLELYVKVQKDWRENTSLLQELGYYPS